MLDSSRRTRRPHPLAWAFLVLVLFTVDQAGAGEAAPSGDWGVGSPMPIAVDRGKASFEIPRPSAGSKALVVVSSLAMGGESFPIRVSARGVTAAVRPGKRADDGRREARERPAKPDGSPPPAPQVLPPVERTFHLMVRDGDIASASNYRAVVGRLRAVGKRVQVYVDSQDVDDVKPEVLRDVAATFDERVEPTVARAVGRCRDVDGDGRFTVLLTRWLARLGGGRLAVDGFVRGSDLDMSLAAPFGNRCDMMYLNAGLSAGPHLRTVLAHEYSHAVTSSLKAFDGATGERSGTEEEGWLDEAISHLVEDLLGFSRSNLDYRTSAFLSCPERYRLVVDDYFSADLFRGHGNRGSTYLFLRWCVDRYGSDLLGALARSPRRGVDCLEASTGATFADLFRRWTTSLALSAHLAVAPRPSSSDPWMLSGPRTTRIAIDDAPMTWNAVGTSGRYLLIDPAESASGAIRIDVDAAPEAQIQVTAILLPPDLARLELAVIPEPGYAESGLVRIRAQNRGGSTARLAGLSWEPTVPAADPAKAGFRRGGLVGPTFSSAFRSNELPGGGATESAPFRMSAGPIPLTVKIIGGDARGRRVVGWADFPPPSGS